MRTQDEKKGMRIRMRRKTEQTSVEILISKESWREGRTTLREQRGKKKLFSCKGEQEGTNATWRRRVGRRMEHAH